MAEAHAPMIDADALSASYLGSIHALLTRILEEERDALDRAADRLAAHIAADRLIYVFGPGGHSNLAAQEIFFRAGGLMHVSAILDEGTLLSNGALRSMAIERTPGYGKVVIADRGLGAEDLLILVNAYGINAALIDAALEARKRGVFLIGVSSRDHADGTSPDHPARHPTNAICMRWWTSPSIRRSPSGTPSFSFRVWANGLRRSRRSPMHLRSTASSSAPWRSSSSAAWSRPSGERQCAWRRRGQCALPAPLPRPGQGSLSARTVIWAVSGNRRRHRRRDRRWSDRRDP